MKKVILALTLVSFLGAAALVAGNKDKEKKSCSSSENKSCCSKKKDAACNTKKEETKTEGTKTEEKPQ